ncbi:MAG: Imm40 family immunity protein [Bacteroidota bacterium]
MTAISEYLDLVKSKGRPLREINPGSDEIALDIDEALAAIEILKGNELPILGGDILSTDSGKLIYAYQFWGSEYHYLNWYCNELDNESRVEYSKRSYEVAKKAINEAVKVSQELGKDCLVVLVV